MTIEVKPAPAILVFPWMGASKNAISKYLEVYKTFLPNAAVVVKEMSMLDFLWPSSGLKNCKKFLSDIEKSVLSIDRPIIIHSMSIGCYFYSLLLLVLKSYPNEFHKIRRNIAAQVIDSPVCGTIHEMAVGVSTSSSSNKLIQRIYMYVAMFYFSVSKFSTVKTYDKLLDMFKYDPPYVPSLVLSCADDPLALPQAFNDFVDAWKRLPFDVVSKVWADSVHVHHLRYHRETYCDLLSNLLNASLHSRPAPSKL